MTHHRTDTNGLFSRSDPSPTERRLIGVLPGEGIGPSVTNSALEVLGVVGLRFGHDFDIRIGGRIGREAEADSGTPLPKDVVDFCHEIFAGSGAILAGAGGGRFVYDVRREFDLYCKLTPVRPFASLSGIGPIQPERVALADLLMIRDNAGGVYQGTWSSPADGASHSRAQHVFSYSRFDVERIVRLAARLASARHGRLAVIGKESGIPTVTALWRDCAEAAASDERVACSFLDVDHAAYKLVAEPEAFDVIGAPNLLGDILGDLAAVFQGSRGNSYSASYSESGSAIYQTNHGAAYDLAGANQANPAGQILSLAMLLRESFGLEDEANSIVDALEEAWRTGSRTFDVRESGGPVVGTDEFTRVVCETIAQGRGKGTHEIGSHSDRLAT